MGEQMSEQTHDLLRLYGGRNSEHMLTLDDATIDDLLEALRIKFNLALNRQRQSYEEERRFLLKCYIDTYHKLHLAKSLLRRLVRMIRKMDGQAPKGLVRLAQDAQKLLKEGATDAGENSTEVAKSKGGSARSAGEDADGN
jgi:hypothetical protein